MSQSGGISIGFAKIIASEADIGSKVSFKGQHRVLKCIGAGDAIAIWEFEEAPERGEGILHHVELVVTLPADLPAGCTLSVTADLCRPGLEGQVDKFRRMILGDRRHSFSIAFPQAPEPQSQIWFDRILKPLRQGGQDN